MFLLKTPFLERILSVDGRTCAAVEPSEAHYGFAGNERKPHAKTMDSNNPVGEIMTAWEAANWAQLQRVQNRHAHNLLKTVARPAGLEPGTSWFVVPARANAQSITK